MVEWTMVDPVIIPLSPVYACPKHGFEWQAKCDDCFRVQDAYVKRKIADKRAVQP